ncbi:AMP-binding protein [Nocardiopsis suaedae]|uniref:AMP-binding protein n=1 Tax=Nocardiopsis suaedae TaxID=3018444 RepID=A0ABT4TVN4_9ACTN|nr:AMP-binding protein [Nocardiopsis suaedae]MDA2808309.1 AMP-binding protein [Nocardiopsis suaedae]
MLLGSADQGRTDVPAVRVGDEAIDRSSLWEAASAFAARIAGAPAVAVHGESSLSTVVAVVGGVLAGVPVVPVPADAGTAERRHILDDSKAALWAGPALDEVGVPRVPAAPADRAPAGFRAADPGPEAAALIMYTSGTTGPPKGVLIPRRAVAADLDGLADAWRWTRDDVLVHGLPLFHVHGLVLGLLGALRTGSPLVHTVRPRPEAYAAAAEAGGTLFFGVPTVWSRIARERDAATALGSARLLVSGSAGLPAGVAQAMEAAAGLAPVERYGMTESLITLAARADEPARTGWVGRPVTGVQARLRGEDGAPVPADGESIGALQVRGATMFDGYLGLPEATVEAWTPDGWFATGDAAAVDADGRYRIVGRMSVDLIKSGGYRVGAGEVESALLDHPSVREAAVVGVPDEDLGQRIVAYLVGEGIDEKDVVGFVAGRLSVHKRPREVRVVDALPRNAMGKVQKSLL